jgi:hypothetical protein
MNAYLQRRTAIAWGALIVGAILAARLGGQTALPVFPGAEGFGATTVAGRGGTVLTVTNLNDSGAGSLRAALSSTGARTVVFETSGTITLTTDDLIITNPYLTVAGQTAPSPGITIRGGGMRILTHDVLVQHLRVRPGDVLAKQVDRGNAGGFIVLGREHTTVEASETYNVVLDHVTASWATDQDMSTWFPVHDVTVSNSFITEGLRDFSAETPGQCNACGFLIGEHSVRIAIIRTLFAHNIHRFPEVKGDTQTVFVNNVLYDNQHELIDLYDYEGHGPQRSTIIGNVHIPGPSTVLWGFRNPLIYLNANLKPGTRVYQRDNVSPRLLVNNVIGFNPIVAEPPVWSNGITVMPSSEVEAYVKAHAGARPADRDAVDRRIVDEWTNRTGRIIDAPGDVGGYPALGVNTRPLTIPRDANGDDNHSGYTNLEKWLSTFTAQVEGTAISPPQTGIAHPLPH